MGRPACDAKSGRGGQATAESAETPETAAFIREAPRFPYPSWPGPVSTGSPGRSGRWEPCEGGPTFKSALWRKEAVGGQILSCPAPDLLFHRSESQDREEGRLGAAGQRGQAPSLPVSSRGASFITLPVFLSGRELPEHGCQGQSTFGVGVQSEPEAPFLQQPPGALPPRGAGLWLHGQPKPGLPRGRAGMGRS